MAFNISNEEFNRAFGTGPKQNINKSSSKELVDKFLKDLNTYLAKQRYPQARAIKEWMDSGGRLSTFTARADVVDSVASALKENKIPFVLVRERRGNYGFLIREKDSIAQKKISREVLEKESNFCHVMGNDQILNAYRRTKHRDKEMLSICNLSLTEVTYLEELCDRVFPNEAIGVGQMEDGTYILTCHGQTAIKHKRGQELTFPAAVSTMLTLMNGNAAREMNKRTIDSIKYRDAKLLDFPDKDGGFKQTVYIVGDSYNFIKRDGRGFVSCFAEEIGGQIILNDDFAVLNDDENYYGKLNSSLSNIRNKSILYSEEDVIMYFKDKRNFMKNPAIKGEEVLMNYCNFIVSNKIKRDVIMNQDGKWNDKFKHYQNEISKVLMGVQQGKVPKGYKKEQIMKLIKIGQSFKLDFNKLTPAIGKIRGIEAYSIDSSFDRVHSVEQEINKYRMTQDTSRNAPSLNREQQNQRDNGFGQR